MNENLKKYDFPTLNVAPKAYSSVSSSKDDCNVINRIAYQSIGVIPAVIKKAVKIDSHKTTRVSQSLFKEL